MVQEQGPHGALDLGGFSAPCGKFDPGLRPSKGVYPALLPRCNDSHRRR